MRPMRCVFPLIFAVCAGLLFGPGSGPVQAADSTQIEAGKTLMLGGEQTTERQLRGRNAGGVAVEFLLMANGRERAVATVEPGKSFELRLPARNTALFRNASERRATLKFEMAEDVAGLSMRYQGE